MSPLLRKCLSVVAIATAVLGGSLEGTAQQQFPGQQKGQQVQQQQGQPNTQLQQQINAELERAKARQAFQRGLTMARNAEQRLLNLGETPDAIEVLRSSAGQRSR
jgi:hypothetical protein